VRSTADSGAPEDLSNCSARAPLEGVYFLTTCTKPSAYVLSADVRDVKVEDDDA
jgi:hypothetical protein